MINGMTVFNTERTEILKQPMFLGAPLGAQRYDIFKYPEFDRLTQQQLSFFWRPEEVSLQKDRSDYLTLRPEQKHIFTSNLKYQILLDSVQGRGISMAFLPYCSLPELESCVTAWGFMEMIHSRSYSYIIKNIYSNPSEVFDTIINDEMILQRATSVTEAYNEFINNAHQYDNGSMWKFANEGVKLGVDERKELKRKLYRAIMNVNILEGVRFYVSFACSFAFGELKLMEGSAKIISLIARDEASHLNITQKILTKWKQGDDPEMIQIAEEEEDWAINMFKLAGDQEMSWATYLFKDGSIIGLNDKILCSYAQWIINLRMKPLGFKPIYDVPFKANPLPWTEHWLNSKSVQEAPQETEKESYLVGAIKQDIDSDTFSGFKL